MYSSEKKDFSKRSGSSSSAGGSGSSRSGRSSSRVPPALEKVLTLDRKVTKAFTDTATRLCPQLNFSYRTYLKGLEVSCHGLPWFAVILITIYVFKSKEAREIQVNLFLGLLFDVMIIAFLKAVTRRTRPHGSRSEDLFLALKVDRFSFPSGHASRAVFLALFFTNWVFPEASILIRAPFLFWAFAVVISRVLLRRHFILDVLAGIVLGYFEYILAGIMWIGPTASKWLGDWLSQAEDEYN